MLRLIKISLSIYKAWTELGFFTVMQSTALAELLFVGFVYYA